MLRNGFGPKGVFSVNESSVTSNPSLVNELSINCGQGQMEIDLCKFNLMTGKCNLTSLPVALDHVPPCPGPVLSALDPVSD
jgi:hypothetical protein